MMSPGWRAPCWLQVFGKVAGCWSILWNRFGASASQAFAGEIDAMGVVNEPVEDGVGICRVTDEGVPFVDRDLTGENGRATPIAFLEDLVEITTCTGVERFEAPIIEDQKLDASETTQDAGIATVTSGEREFGEELGNPLIENRAVIAAGLVTQGTSKPRFAHAGRSAQDQIVVRVDPLGIGELVEQSAVEAAWGSVIDVLDAGLLAQSGIAQSGGQPLVAAMGELAIDQQRKPVGMGERGSLVGSFEFGKRLGHAG